MNNDQSKRRLSHQWARNITLNMKNMNKTNIPIQLSNYIMIQYGYTTNVIACL